MTQTEWLASDDPQAMLRWLLRDNGPYGPDRGTEDLTEAEQDGLHDRLRQLATACYHAGPAAPGDPTPDEFDNVAFGVENPAQAFDHYLSAVPGVRARQAELVREAFDPWCADAPVVVAGSPVQ